MVMAHALLLAALAAAPAAPPDEAADEPLVREVRISVRVEGDGRDARIELPLARPDAGQEILSEQLTLRGFRSEEVVRDGNRLAVLTHPAFTGRKRITYTFTVRSRGLAVPVAPAPYADPGEARDELRRWLRTTRHLQASSPLIREKLQTYATPRLAAGETDAIRIAWDLVHTYEKKASGSRNVLKATRTGHASSLGLERLFATFLRTSGVPARTVGGVDLRKEKGRRTVYWTEVLAGGAWVPMAPSRDLAGVRPARFLRLWHGDRPLVVRDGVAKVTYKIRVRPAAVAP